jgi:hypothetical protein
MKVRQAIALSALSLIGSAVHAATGDAADYYINREIQSPSTLTRSQVKADVRQARIDGKLQAAGEGEPYALAQLPRASDRTRAEVKAEVLAARAAGELLPAGEGSEFLAPGSAHRGSATGRLANVWSKRPGGQ